MSRPKTRDIVDPDVIAALRHRFPGDPEHIRLVVETLQGFRPEDMKEAFRGGKVPIPLCKALGEVAKSIKLADLRGQIRDSVFFDGNRRQLCVLLDTLAGSPDIWAIAKALPPLVEFHRKYRECLL